MPSLRKLLFEDEAVAGINSPFEYPYLKLLYVSLRCVSCWPLKEMGLHEPKVLTMIHKYTLLMMFVGCTGGCALYIYLHNATLDFLEIGHMYLVELMAIVNLSRVITLTFSTKYREVAKDFLTKTHIFYYKDLSEFAMKTHKRVHLVSHLFTIAVLCQLLVGLSFFNLIPMYNNYYLGKYKTNGLQNRTLEHSLYFSYPFDVSTNFKGYTIVCIVHWFLSYISATYFCMMDLFLSLMIFHLWGHFHILIDKINNFPRPSHEVNTILEEKSSINIDMYSKDEHLQVSDKLKECIDYHREIKIFTDRISTVFGSTLFVKFLFHQISGCLLLLECSQMTTGALLRYLPLTIICFQQLIQLSVVFELLGSASERLKDAVYGLPWECMDTRNRKLVAFFLMNVQEPIVVKAMGVAAIGVNTMLTILKTSMSYFTFLNSM